jgi:ankyrin repeat protein
LHFACQGQASLEVVQFLVERNPAALEAADHGGWLPLHYACQYQASLEVVQFLVETPPLSEWSTILDVCLCTLHARPRHR